jgi:hypothetical protein
VIFPAEGVDSRFCRSPWNRSNGCDIFFVILPDFDDDTLNSDVKKVTKMNAAKKTMKKRIERKKTEKLQLWQTNRSPNIFGQ